MSNIRSNSDNTADLRVKDRTSSLNPNPIAAARGRKFSANDLFASDATERTVDMEATLIQR
jgi:hypothetical protein